METAEPLIQRAGAGVPPPGSETTLQSTLFIHAYLRAAVDRVVSIVTRPGGPQFVALFGPPGVGKSRVLQLIENSLAYHWRAELEADPQAHPVVRVEVPAAIGHEFVWREYGVETLQALGDPGVDRLVGSDAGPHRVLRPGRLGANELLRIAERRYRERGVHALLLDEAQHMALARSIVDLRHNLDILKSFANKTGVRIVLVGAYELLQFHQASAQLARRIPSVHLPRYRWTVQHERAEFERVCRQMLGCIGYLRDWLVSAEHEFRTSGRSWSACLAAAAASEVTVNSMLDEIEPAETRAEATVTGRKKLRLRLGLTAVRQSGTGKSAAAGKNAVAGAPRSRRRAGRRAPRRDAVGDQHG